MSSNSKSMSSITSWESELTPSQKAEKQPNCKVRLYLKLQQEKHKCPFSCKKSTDRAPWTKDTSGVPKAAGSLAPLRTVKVEAAKASKTPPHPGVKVNQRIHLGGCGGTPHLVNKTGMSRTRPQKPQADLRVFQQRQGLQQVSGHWTRPAVWAATNKAPPTAAPRRLGERHTAWRHSAHSASSAAGWRRSQSAGTSPCKVPARWASMWLCILRCHF